MVVAWLLYIELSAVRIHFPLSWRVIVISRWNVVSMVALETMRRWYEPWSSHQTQHISTDWELGVSDMRHYVRTRTGFKRINAYLPQVPQQKHQQIPDSINADKNPTSSASCKMEISAIVALVSSCALNFFLLEVHFYSKGDTRMGVHCPTRDRARQCREEMGYRR